MKKSCLDCFNFVTKIPVIHKNNSILESKLDYRRAVALCKYRLIAKENGKPRIFKRILSGKNLKNLKAYSQAERCEYYENEQP